VALILVLTKDHIQEVDKRNGCYTPDKHNTLSFSCTGRMLQCVRHEEVAYKFQVL
jgi:FtsZ-interacting cell division protein YlmF